MDNLKVSDVALSKLERIAQQLRESFSRAELERPEPMNARGQCDCGGGCSGSCRGQCGGCGSGCKGGLTLWVEADLRDNQQANGIIGATKAFA